MKYVSWWVVIVLFFPVVALGFVVEAVIKAFVIGRLVFEWLGEEAT